MTAEPAPGSWLDLAACRGRPTAWWFPEQGDSFAVAVARSICRSCPVRHECLADAIAVEDSWYRVGIRGGLLPGERRAAAR